MDPEDIINLFDSCWFNLEILKKDSFKSNSETNPHLQIQQTPSKPIIKSLPSILVRSKSDEFSSLSSFSSDFQSPNSVIFRPKLQTILSGKEEMRRPSHHNEEEHKKRKNIVRARRKNGGSKSLSELEFEEVKGFMDLGFVFSEEDKDSRLVEIIPGLQRLGKEEKEESSVGVPRPYLSEAWEVLDTRKKEIPLMNWSVPALDNEVNMKDSLKWWAHTVVSSVR